MFISRFISLLVVFAVVCGSISAQELPASQKISPELEKNALELLELTVGEAAGLRLAENRALVYALAGDAFWTRDEKRARSLFRAAGAEIAQAVNIKVESSEPQRMLEGNFGRMEIFNLRQMVLRTLSERDAEMALEILRATRTPEISAEVQSYAMPAAPVPGAPRSQTAAATAPETPRNFRVEQEIRLEQGLIAKAAEQDPSKAAQRIRESLEKGFSMEILAALYRMYKKDAETAEKLLGEVVQKLLAADLSKNPASLNFAVGLVRPYAFPPKENPDAKPEARLTLDDKSIRDVVNKIAETLLRATNPNQASSFNFALPVLQKLAPEKTALLKQKQAALKKQQPQSSNRVVSEALDTINDPNATPEKLIADAARAPAGTRGLYYRQAAFRANSSGSGSDPEKIRALLQNQPESRDRDNAIAMLDAVIVGRQLRSGKLDEARRLIDRMPYGAARAEQLVQMAVAAYRLNTKESRENAAQLLEEARQMVRDFPETKDETEGLLKIVAGFAVVDAQRAFAMLAPVLEQTNEIVQAQAVLARYHKQTQFFRDGEMIMANNFGALNSTVFRYAREIRLLAQTDFARTRSMIDQFRRDDVRLFVKLFIAQSILKERIGMEGGMTFGGGGAN